MPPAERSGWGTIDVVESGLVIGLLALPMFYVPGWNLPHKSALYAFHLIQLGLCVRANESSGYMILLTFCWDVLLLGTQYALYGGYLNETFYNLNVNTNDTYKECVKLGILFAAFVVSMIRGFNLFTQWDMQTRAENYAERIREKQERLEEVMISKPSARRKLIKKQMSIQQAPPMREVIYVQAPMSNPYGPMGYQPNYYPQPPTGNGQRLLMAQPYG